MGSSASASATATTVDVTSAAHALAGGQPAGTVTTTTAGVNHGWGTPAASAKVVATMPGQPSQANVFTYPRDGSSAAGVRVGWFWYGGAGANANTAAQAMADAVVNYVAPVAGTTVTYTRDATDRIVARTATGEATVRYAHSASGDAPTAMLDIGGNVTQASIGLPGGAILHRDPNSPTASTWSYPNLQGSIAAQATSGGVKTGTTFVYDPDGIPVAGGLPDTRPGSMDDTWHGGASRPLEHAAGLQPVIEMGARQYHPVLARFLETDPVEGGFINDYGYVSDPIGERDLGGQCSLGNYLKASWQKLRNWQRPTACDMQDRRSPMSSSTTEFARRTIDQFNYSVELGIYWVRRGGQYYCGGWQVYQFARKVGSGPWGFGACIVNSAFTNPSPVLGQPWQDVRPK